jgi:Ca2+-binding RTX toxin-like protein
MIFDPKLFYNDPLNPQPNAPENFLERLVKHQAGVQPDPVTGAAAIPADTMVTRFTSDMWRLAQDGGLTMADGNPNPALHELSQTLIAFAMQKYYTETASSPGYNEQLFGDLANVNAGSGGIHFDLHDVAQSVGATKGLKYFKNYLRQSTFTPSAADLIAANVGSERDWYVQAGPTAMSATDTQNRGAFMLGFDDADTLVGGTGNDLLVGNKGADTLRGGAGDDILIGGLGDDTYVLDNIADIVTENSGEGIDLVRSSVAYTLTEDVENLTLTGTNAINGTGNALDNVITGNSAKNTLTGGAGNDTLVGLAGADMMIGGTGDDIYVVDASNDVLTENAGEGSDTIQSIVGWTLGANFENLILTGAAGANGTGNAVDNLLVGNTGNNTLTGLAGNDILQGLAGNDILNDSAGNTLFDGGAGTDMLTGNAGNEMFIGGLGNDTITTGAGADLIAFNSGSGQDIVNASAGMDNVLSLGGGISYSGLTFTKSGKNLILKTGGTDQITFKDWYAQGSSSVTTLQVFTEAMPGYNPTGNNKLLDNKVEQFDFTALATAFDASGQVSGWALTNALLDVRLSGSGDNEAIGGDLAYQYGLNGNLAGIGLSQAQQVLNAPQFGSANQALRPVAELQTGQIKLS